MVHTYTGINDVKCAQIFVPCCSAEVPPAASLVRSCGNFEISVRSRVAVPCTICTSTTVAQSANPSKSWPSTKLLSLVARFGHKGRDRGEARGKVEGCLRLIISDGKPTRYSLHKKPI